jgi:ParB family chromosome partitioning protein
MAQSFLLSEITVPKGRRQLRNLDELAASMQDIGLLNPITVTEKDHILVAGGRRLGAARQLGWEEIAVTLVDLDELSTELAEIDENLIRDELTALERAEALKRRKEIYEAIHPETKHVSERGGPGRGNKTTAKMSAVSFTDDAARKTGQSARNVRRDVSLASRIPDDVKATLAGTPAANKKSELEQLAKYAPEDQRTIAERLKTGEAKTVREAAGVPPSPKEAQKIADRTGKSVAASNNKFVYPTSQHAKVKAESAELQKVRGYWDAMRELAAGEITAKDWVRLAPKYGCRDVARVARTAWGWLDIAVKEIEAQKQRSA